MKEYTTRYDTAEMHGVCYSFKAESDEAAEYFVNTTLQISQTYNYTTTPTRRRPVQGVW